MRKKFFTLAFLIFLLSSYAPHTSATHAKTPHGIILISLDTLRADHLGSYGYHRNTSPFIDAFAKESIVFENFIVQSPWTLPSHMSIMTSLYPSSHGVYDKNSRLADEQVTLAELLRKEGYRTAAFVDGGYMNALFGFNQGFDIYNGGGLEDIEQVDQLGKGIAHILPEVKKWLNKNKSDPFFLFIHCYDIHNPYDPPPPYDKIFHDFTYAGNLVPNSETLMEAAWKGLKTNSEDVRHFKALYDGGIRYTDEKIGEFLSYVKETGIEDNSLIIITSDHGEEFKEHGSFLHWQLYYKPNLHVPLIMRIPNYPKKEIRITERAQSIDLMPTILEIAGHPKYPEAQGRNLLPLIEHNKNFLSPSLAGTVRDPKQKSPPSFAEAPKASKYSIITDTHQMIYSLKSKSIQLFNFKTDPFQKNDIAGDHGDISKALLLQLNATFNATRKYKAPAVTLDSKTREQLKALGYIQ